MALSRTVMLKSGPGVLGFIQRAIAESGIPEDERVLLCSPALMGWLFRRLGMLPEAEMRQALGADVISVGYLENRKILITNRENARRITGK